jgi:hypothetical protein
MKMSPPRIATFVLAGLMSWTVGCGTSAPPADTPASIEEGQKIAKQRIQREYGQSSKKSANIK